MGTQQTTNPQNVAFIGMGTMGGAMSANLARSGHNVYIWNRTPGRPGESLALSSGAHLCASIGEAASRCRYIFVCVGDESDVAEVVLGTGGIAGNASKGSVVIDTSTSGPACARELDARLKEAGLRFLDAPVTGGDVGAKAATLTIMVGGEAEDFEECRPLFACLGKHIVHCGGAGSGQSVKLCNQILCAVNMVAVCEAIELARELGADPALMIDVCSTGAGGSWALANLGPKIVEGNMRPGFMIKHILKDLRLVKECLGGTTESLPGTTLAGKLFDRAVQQNDGSESPLGTQAMSLSYRGRRQTPQ